MNCAGEAGRGGELAARVAHGVVRCAARAPRARARAARPSARSKPALVDAKAVLGGDLARQVDREAEGVVQPEDVLGAEALLAVRRARAISSSSSRMPCSSVRPKPSSSAASHVWIASRCSPSSG